MEEKIAFIVEGKYERDFLQKLFKAHIPQAEPEFFIWATDSTRFSEKFVAAMKKHREEMDENLGDELDIMPFLREVIASCPSSDKENSSFEKFFKKSEYPPAAIYFLFDLDLQQGQGENGPSEVYQQLQKLYQPEYLKMFEENNLQIFISYPMLEAARDFKREGDKLSFRDYVTYKGKKCYQHEDKSCKYKELVGDYDNGHNVEHLKCEKYFKIWVKHHCDLSRRLVNPVAAALPSQKKILEEQKYAFEQEAKKIYVLSGIPFVFCEYFGEKYFSSH